MQNGKLKSIHNTHIFNKVKARKDTDIVELQIYGFNFFIIVERGDFLGKKRKFCKSRQFNERTRLTMEQIFECQYFAADKYSHVIYLAHQEATSKLKNCTKTPPKTPPAKA